MTTGILINKEDEIIFNNKNKLTKKMGTKINMQIGLQILFQVIQLVALSSKNFL